MVQTFVSERDEGEWLPQVKGALSSYIESHHRQGIRVGEGSAVTAEQQDRFVDFGITREMIMESLVNVGKIIAHESFGSH